MGVGSGMQAVAGRRRVTRHLSKASVLKTSKLIKEAGKTLDENSAKIAKSLLDNTLAGSVQSARLLLELADREVGRQDAETTERHYSQADQLAAEPQWTGEVVAAAVKTGAGGQAPES
jgi:thioredoxin-like negative regulator of GroEL